MQDNSGVEITESDPSLALSQWIRRGWLVLILLAIPLSLLTGLRAVSAQNDRVVTLSVDGQKRGFATDAGTVAEVLRRAQVGLGEHDLVEPALGTTINTQVFYINVYRAKHVVVVDGDREIAVDTPYQFPKSIASESAGLKVYPEDEYRIEPLRDIALEGRIGYRMQVLRAVPVTLTVDGRTFGVRTRKTTVADLLAEKGVKLGDKDQLTVKRNAKVKAGMHIIVLRGGKQVISVEEVIPFAVQSIFDNNRPAGSEEVKQAGKNGKRLVTYEIVYKKGIEIKRKELQSVILSQPIKRIVIRGVTYASDVWGALRLCESGGDYTRNSGNGYYGAYQFSYGTWQGMGTGYERADLAPPDVQDGAAQRLQARSGWGQWPACARKLGLY